MTEINTSSSLEAAKIEEQRPSDDKLKTFFTNIANLDYGIALHGTPRHNIPAIKFRGLKPGDRYGDLHFFQINPRNQDIKKLLENNDFDTLWNKLCGSIQSASAYANSHDTASLPTIVVAASPMPLTDGITTKDTFNSCDTTQPIKRSDLLMTISRRAIVYKGFRFQKEPLDDFTYRAATAIVHHFAKPLQ